MSMPAASCNGVEPRKHSKTFTGCWTCRSRKVKCDEARPTCIQCRSKSLVCEGYGVRLQWVSPSSGHTGSDRDVPKVKTQRSQIAAEHNFLSLESSEIDHILDSIDAYESGPAARRVNDHLFIHHFGVFDPGLPFMEASPPSSASIIPDAVTTPSISSDNTEPSYSGIPDFQSDISLDRVQTDDAATQDTLSALLESVDPSLYLGHDDALLHGNEFSSTFGLGTPSNSWFGSTDLTIHGSRDLIDSKSQDDAHGADDILPQHCQWQTPNGTIIRNPCPHSLPEQEQFLMYHYSHRAVNLFCVIDNRKSPWKTIHLPRALQSIGQLTIAGASSSIRDALRNALLSISAFYLSNDSKSRLCSDESARWTRKATMLRGQAIELLKDAVENALNDKAVPKYKEFLATMLSMITINVSVPKLKGVHAHLTNISQVMSGDTTTCGLHLDGAFRFMTQARTWKTKFSPKAIALHRIYFYLRAIYESTALDQEHSDLAALPPGFETATSPSTDTDTLPQPLRLTWPENSNVADICLSGDVGRSTEPGMQMSTYECIYGVPQNLLVLFFKTTRLIREVICIRTKGGRSAAMPPDLAMRCDSLEHTIMDWSIDLELERCRVEGTMGPSYDIIHQTTHAFHNALIIYFAQHIRLLSYRYLQSYVQLVLESIEAIEEIKAESRILAAPIYWPAFIAASEAFNDRLQARFKTWFDQMEVYGIEATRSGICVLNEVWKSGPIAGTDITSRWRMVVDETRAHLMLS